MKIKILKNEHLFDKNGLHILNEKGIAITAIEDIECEIDDQHSERVLSILVGQRNIRGLDADGNRIVESVVEELPVEQPVKPVVEEVVEELPIQESTAEQSLSEEVQ